MVYILVFTFLATLSLGDLIELPKITRYFWIVVALLLLIVLGSLRWNTGSDWNPYFNFFAKGDLNDPVFMLSMEPGFALFVGFLRLFSDSFTFYLTALSLICISLKGIVLVRFTKAVFVAILLYWGTVLGDIVAVRQGIAISICCISTIYIIERKFFKFFLLVILATQIHTTALLFVFAYPVFYADWSVKSKVITMLIALILGLNVGYEVILDKIISITPSGFGLERLSEKAEVYKDLGSEAFEKDEKLTLGRLISAILKRSILLPIFFYYQNIYKENYLYKGFLNLYTLGNFIFFLFVDFSVLQRAAMPFYFFEILLFTIIFENTRSKGIWLLIIVTYSFLKMVANIIPAHDLLLPYIWIFSDDTYRYMY